MKKKYGYEFEELVGIEMKLRSLFEQSRQLAVQLMDMLSYYITLCFSASQIEHFRPFVLRLQVLHFIENVSYFPNLLYFMNRPSPTNENIPNNMKLNGFDESILAVPTSQFTKHCTSFS